MTNFKGLVIADVHWGAMDPFLLYDELDKIFLEHVRNNNDIDFVIVSGDYFDKKLSLNSNASKLAIKFINELLQLSITNDFKVRMIVGTKTHDFNQLDNFKPYELDPSYDFKVINTVESETLFEDMTVLYVPEEYMEKPDEYYAPLTSDILSEDVKYDMIFFHGTYDFIAFKDQILDSERPIKNAPVFKYDVWEDYSWGPICGGHIHTGESHKDKVFYTSSFSRWSHGEPQPKGFLEVSYDSETLDYSVERVENTLAREFTTYRISDIRNKNDSIEDTVERIKELQKDSNIRIQFDIDSKDSDISIIREHFHGENNLKLDVRDRIQAKDEQERDERFDFILNREYDVPETIQKFLKINNEVEVPIDKIKEVLKVE